MFKFRNFDISAYITKYLYFYFIWDYLKWFLSFLICFRHFLILFALSCQKLIYIIKLFNKLAFILVISWTDLSFPVSQISALTSNFLIYLDLFCFYYSGFLICLHGSFISNLSCYLVNAFEVLIIPVSTSLD